MIESRPPSSRPRLRQDRDLTIWNWDYHFRERDFQNPRSRLRPIPSILTLTPLRFSCPFGCPLDDVIALSAFDCLGASSLLQYKRESGLIVICVIHRHREQMHWIDILLSDSVEDRLSISVGQFYEVLWSRLKSLTRPETDIWNLKHRQDRDLWNWDSRSYTSLLHINPLTKIAWFYYANAAESPAMGLVAQREEWCRKVSEINTKNIV